MSEGSDAPLSRAARRAALMPTAVDPEAPPARPRIIVAAATVVAALVVAALSREVDHRLLIVGYAALGAVMSLGWPRLTRSATPVGSAVVLLVTLAGCVGALMLDDGAADLAKVAAGIGAGVVAMCFQPLLQAPARENLVSTLTGSALGIGVLTCGAVLVASPTGPGSPIAVAGIALAVAAVPDLATESPRREAWMLPAGVLAGGGAGLVAEMVLGNGLGAWAALVGMLVAGVALCLRRVLAQLPTIDTLPGAVAAGIASVLVAGPVVSLLTRALLG